MRTCEGEGDAQSKWISSSITTLNRASIALLHNVVLCYYCSEYAQKCFTINVFTEQ